MEIQKYDKNTFSKIDGVFLSFVEQLCLINNNFPIWDTYKRISTHSAIYDSCLEYFNYYGDKEGIPQIWVVTDNKEFQGFIMGFIPKKNVTPFIPKYVDYSSDFYIGSLYVLPRYQKKGVGSKLLRIVQDYCSEKGYQKMFLNVDFINTKSFNFYINRGFYVTKKNEQNKVYFMCRDIKK